MAHTEKTARKSIGAKRSPASAEAIRAAAEEILLESGYAGFSIEAVAKRARAGKPTIYRWWPSKAALLLDVYQRQKKVADPDTGTLEDDLFEFLRSLFVHWRETPSGSIFRSIIAEAQNDGQAAEALSAYSNDRASHTNKIVQRAIQRGEIPAETDGVLLADLVSSYAWKHLLTGRLDETDDQLRKAVRYLIRGSVGQVR